ncbi:EamA family transporter [uncultured Kocuria sp.]|uniref:EamA family transporter n=1 Tax=uncultured Kocuria sp. TaxID=259305 RepID=UPI00345AE9E1
MARLPLGVAVTIELLGPLVLSVVLSRRLTGVLWAGLALAGVRLLSGVGPGTEIPDPAGVLFALGAASLWVLYILMSRQAGRSFPGVQGLALAMVVGAVLAAPFGIVSGGAALLRPHVLLIGLSVALMSSALPYALELAAETFSILVSMAPAAAALVGWLILGQELGAAELAGMTLVILASVAAVRAGRAPSKGPTPPTA